MRQPAITNTSGDLNDLLSVLQDIRDEIRGLGSSLSMGRPWPRFFATTSRIIGASSSYPFVMIRFRGH